LADFDSDPAVGVCFAVTVDGQDLGAFMSCDGLGCEVKVTTREEGGQNGFVYKLPGRVEYTNVKLSRPVNKDSAKIAKWFSKMASTPSRTTAQIRALTANGAEVAKWALVDVFPVRWTGPSFTVDSPKVATETLELAHHGFLNV
jgi:phage tail-like protein